MRACYEGHVDVIKVLLKNGADRDAKDVVRRKHAVPSSARVLLSGAQFATLGEASCANVFGDAVSTRAGVTHAVDAAARDATQDGCDALFWAKEKKMGEVVQLLEVR